MTDRSIRADAQAHARRTTPHADDARLAEIRAAAAEPGWWTMSRPDVELLITEIGRLEAERDQAHADVNDNARLVFENQDRARQAEAGRDRYRSAWQSARRERARLRGIIAANWETAETFANGGVNDIAELYHAQDAIQAAGGQLTRPVHKAIDAIRAKWDRVLRSEQQKRADAEATVARATALAADMRTWCSPHGLADHYADQLDQAIAGPNPNPPYDLPAGFRAGAGGEQ